MTIVLLHLTGLMKSIALVWPIFHIIYHLIQILPRYYSFFNGILIGYSKTGDSKVVMITFNAWKQPSIRDQFGW